MLLKNRNSKQFVTMRALFPFNSHFTVALPSVALHRNLKRVYQNKKLETLVSKGLTCIYDLGARMTAAKDSCFCKE